MPVSLRPTLARLPLGKLLFELFLVFVAVLAALGANAWWQDVRERAAGVAALRAFAVEMRSNREQIATRMPHHQTIVANTGAFLHDVRGGATPPTEIAELRTRLTSGQGMRTPLLSRAAWDTALATGAFSQVPFSNVQRIARVYEVQHRLELLLDQLIENFTSPTYFDVARVEPTATAFLVTFQMIVELENEQVGEYDRCLGDLGGD